jgi:DNA-binding NarL/FixJ family response regulator
VRCALALRELAQTLDFGLAASVHTGEVEIREDAVEGLALHVARQIAARAAAGEVLASAVVKDLVPGSGLHFVDRGEETIEGVNGRLHLVAVMAEQHLEPQSRAGRAPRLETLSPREREVLALVAEGLSNAAIARRLRLSDHTVKRHVANILLKLDLPTRAAAAALIGRQRQP